MGDFISTRNYQNSQYYSKGLLKGKVRFNLTGRSKRKVEDNEELELIKAKLSRQEYMKKIDEEKKMQEYKEQEKLKKDQLKALKFKHQIKQILAIVLFAVILALHLTLSFLQRDYSGTEISTSVIGKRIDDLMKTKDVIFSNTVG